MNDEPTIEITSTLSAVTNDATRIRVIRAFLAMTSSALAERLGVCTGTITNWEKGRACPTPSKRDELMQLCIDNGIAFTPSGYPLPVSDLNYF